MSYQQRQEPLGQSRSGDFTPGGGLTTASVAGWQQEPPDQGQEDQGQEKEWEARLSSLQQLIGELLIKNQQLRWLLESATNDQWQEPGNEYDQNAGRR